MQVAARRLTILFFKEVPMLKSFAWACAGAVLFTSVAAQAKSYTCSLKEDFDDWRISADLTTGEGNFFDNDHDSPLTLSAVRSIETFPPIMQYEFTGVDSMDEDTTFVAHIEFPQGREPEAVLFIQNPDGETDTFEFACSED